MSRRKAILAWLIAAHGVINLAVWCSAASEHIFSWSEWKYRTFIVFSSGPVALAAIWLAMGRTRLLARYATLLGVGSLCALSATGVIAHSNRDVFADFVLQNLDFVSLVADYLIVQTVGVLIPLVLARIAGLSLVNMNSSNGHIDENLGNSQQFSLLSLFTLTTVCAVSTALFLAYCRVLEEDAVERIWRLLGDFESLARFGSVVTIALLCALSNWRTQWSVVVSLLTGLLAHVVEQYYLGGQELHIIPDHFAYFIVTLFAFRLLGYRISFRWRCRGAGDA